MPEIKLNLDDPSSAVESLRHIAREYLEKQRSEGMVGNGFGFPLLQRLTDQIERQLPKAPVEEPTGDVVIAASSGWFFEPGGDLGWVRDDLKPYTWEGVLEFGDPTVYRREHAEPTPEQVEAEAVCNCDYVARGGPGASPPRSVEHHPKCDINLPADKRSGPHAQVEADLAQDEQAHTRYYAAAAAEVAEKIAEAVEEEADELDMPTTTEWLELRDWFKDRLHEVAAKAREIGGAS